MGWKDRIAAEAAKAQGKLRDEVAERIAGPDGSASVEGFLLGLVRQARGDDDDDDPATEKEVRKAARKRRRRLGIASFAAGPFAGMAGEATDLYTETATVCDLVDLHDLTLTDAEIGGHMLVLWNVADDMATGRAALDGTGPNVSALMAMRWTAEANAEWREAKNVVEQVKVIWDRRDVVGDLQEKASSGAFKRVLRAGSQTKDFLAQAQAQLGVSGRSPIQ